MLNNYKLYTEKLYSNLKLEESILNPNFSVVVPGGCNGKCSFCFWKETKICENYIPNLIETLELMPSQFYQLSLTGGEPTLSPYLDKILESIDTDRWTHTVLTTNGTNLDKFIDKLKDKIKFINISRHHYKDEINEKVFGTNTVPDKQKLLELTKKLQENGIDVTYSAVITEDLNSKEEIEKYIEFAKSHNVYNVFFRKQHGTLDPSEAEKSFEHIKSKDHNCPVCRNTYQFINECNVTWKASLEEPSKELGMIYEVVYNENGLLTTDWEQNIPVKPYLIKENNSSDGIYESCGGTYSCGSWYNDEDEEDDKIEKDRLKKLRKRNRKINKIKKVISKNKRLIKIERDKKNSKIGQKLFKYDDFIGENKKL